jgi:YVTN family beta-propeller protein
VIDIKTNAIKIVPLTGSAVQTAVIPNSSFVAASVYDTKQMAFYDSATEEVFYIDLPFESEGAIQSYSTPDGRYLYVADQGYYFGKPTSDYVYKIDIENKEVIQRIQAGVAPHGVVVSPDGGKVYVTNLLSDDISVIDTATDKELAKVKVGKMPNGISLWSHQSGGTP